MPSVYFISNDGSVAQLSASEAKAQKEANASIQQQAEFSTRLSEQGVEGLPFKMCEKGVIILGNGAQANAVRNIVETFPGMNFAGNASEASYNDLSSAFRSAARMNVAPARLAFSRAANDVGITPVYPTRRPSIHGNYGLRMAA